MNGQIMTGVNTTGANMIMELREDVLQVISKIVLNDLGDGYGSDNSDSDSDGGCDYGVCDKDSNGGSDSESDCKYGDCDSESNGGSDNSSDC